jgi:hypothetical protein
MPDLNYAEYSDLAANVAGRSVSLSAQSIALLSFALASITEREQWTNNGASLTDAEWDDLNAALGELWEVYTGGA